MFYRLRDGLYHCSVGASVIFLDVTENRYFAVPSAGVEAFRRLVLRNGEDFPGADVALSPLIQKGYLVQSSDPYTAFPTTRTYPAMTDQESSGQSPLHLPTFLLALSWELIISWRLRRCTLSSVIEMSSRISRDNVWSKEIRTLRIQRAVTAFAHTGFIFGRTDRCLPRSLAMYSLCRSLGISIQCVIGVRSNPFAAHAWAQDEDWILNDSVEEVGHYSPILVLS